MSNETAEIYLRQFAEGQLRRLAAGTATAADCASRVDAVAAAFARTGLLDDTTADAITGELGLALAVRSPERDTPLHRGQRAPVSTFRSFGGGRGGYVGTTTPSSARGPAAARAGAVPDRAVPGRGEPAPAPDVVPVGKVLRVRADGADEDIYLLTYVAAGGRAWLSVAARTSEAPVSRLHAPPAGSGGPGARGGRPWTFAARGLSAVGSDGQRYTLGFSGGGGTWFLGRLTLSPPPPPSLEWLDVTGGGQTVRADLTARVPEVTAVVTHVAANRAETYLLQRAENLLSHPALATAEAAGMASVVPALRAVGALSDMSPVPGQIAALCQRLGADGHAIAVPGELPDRWDAALRKPDVLPVPEKHPIAIAHLAGALPPVDGVTITLAGLITRAGQGTTLFGAMHPRPDPDIRVGGPSLWLTGDDGWHTVSVSGWSTHGDGYTFQADVVPPLFPATPIPAPPIPAGLTPAVTDVEVRVTSPGTEARATLPLTWWES